MATYSDSSILLCLKQRYLTLIFTITKSFKSKYLKFCGCVDQECDVAGNIFCVDPSKGAAVIKEMVARVNKKKR